MSMRENAIKEYLSKIDFKEDNWSIYGLSSGMKRFLGEEPAIDVVYKKDVMLNEVNKKSVEVKRLERIKVIFTDDDNILKKIEIILNEPKY